MCAFQYAVSGENVGSVSLKYFCEFYSRGLLVLAQSQLKKFITSCAATTAPGGRGPGVSGEAGTGEGVAVEGALGCESNACLTSVCLSAAEVLKLQP